MQSSALAPEILTQQACDGTQESEFFLRFIARGRMYWLFFFLGKVKHKIMLDMQKDNALISPESPHQTNGKDKTILQDSTTSMRHMFVKSQTLCITHTYLKCIEYLYHLDFLPLLTMDKISFILWKHNITNTIENCVITTNRFKKSLPNQKIFANNMTLKANVINTEKALINQ